MDQNYFHYNNTINTSNDRLIISILLSPSYTEIEMNIHKHPVVINRLDYLVKFINATQSNTKFTIALCTNKVPSNWRFIFMATTSVTSCFKQIFLRNCLHNVLKTSPHLHIINNTEYKFNNKFKQFLRNCLFCSTMIIYGRMTENECQLDKWYWKATNWTMLNAAEICE